MTAGHRHLLDLGAGRLERLGGRLGAGGHVGRDALGVEELLDHADPQAVDAVDRGGRSPTATGSGIDVESAGSCPAITS